MNKEILNSVKKIISEIVDMPINDIPDNASPNIINEWDSMNHLKIILSIEEEYNIKLTKDEIISMINTEIIVGIIETYIS
tara:strand:- start:886 stop:1125 length:240 start_codon:yes stop_codon:yes gene_type:complete